MRHWIELEYRRILFDAQKGQQASTNGLLSGKEKIQRSTSILIVLQAGIGTYNIPEIAKPWMSKLARTLDIMIGIHLNAHIMGVYTFPPFLYEVDFYF